MEKSMKMRSLAFIFASLIIAFACQAGLSEESADVEARFVEMVIKVAPEAIMMPEGTYKAPLGDVDIKSDELKELNRKFNLISIEKMFAKKKSKEEVAKEFSEREAGAPEETEELDLENTFLLRFPEYTDVETLIDEYKTIEEVIYIEENKTVSIY